MFGMLFTYAIVDAAVRHPRVAFVVIFVSWCVISGAALAWAEHVHERNTHHDGL